MEEKAHTEHPRKASVSKGLSKNFQSLVEGVMFTRFVRKQTGFLLFLFVLSLLYITNKYGAEKEVTRIMILKERVTDLRYELQTINSSLVGRNRQSQVLEKLKKNGIDLEPAKTPPYELKR